MTNNDSRKATMTNMDRTKEPELFMVCFEYLGSIAYAVVMRLDTHIRQQCGERTRKGESSTKELPTDS